MVSRAYPLTLIGLLISLAPLRAEVSFDAPVVKLGEVRGGPSVTQRFSLTNKGARLVQLGAVERGCSCLQADLDKTVLAPGESAVLTLALRTLGHKNGPYVWNAKIRYRDGEMIKEVACRLEGAIRNEVTLEPSELVLFVTDELKQEIKLTDLRALPFQIKHMETTLPGVNVTTTGTSPGAFQIQLHALASKIPYGARDGRVDIHTTDPAYPLITLPVRLIRSYSKAVQAVPERIRLNPERGIKSTLVRLRTPDDQALKIARVEAGNLKATWADHPAGGVVLRLMAEGPVPPAIRIVFDPPGRDLELPIDVD